MLLIHTYCTKLLYILYVPTAVRTADVCHYLLLYVLPVPTASTYQVQMTYVRKERKAETYQKKNWPGTTFLNDGRYGQHLCRLLT